LIVRKNVPLLIYIFLSIILFSGNVEQKLAKANLLSRTLYYPFISSVTKLEEIFGITEENKYLISQLADKTLSVNKLERKLEQFKNLDMEFEVDDHDFILVDIIAHSGNFRERNFIIDKGRKDKIKINYPVISNKGIVGKIVSVSQNYSVVLPFNHSSFKLSVITKRNKLLGLLESDIYGNTIMSFIKLGSEIILGDTIVTSNISNIFPEGFPVGVVNSLYESQDKTHMNASIHPFADTSSLDRVIILFYEKDKKYESELNLND